jgi:hypothetical protein
MDYLHEIPRTPPRRPLNPEEKSSKKRMSPPLERNKKRQKDLGKENKPPDFPFIDPPLQGNLKEIVSVRNESVMGIDEKNILGPIQQNTINSLKLAGNSHLEQDSSVNLDELNEKLAKIRDKLILLRDENSESFNHIVDSCERNIESSEFESWLSEGGVNYFLDTYDDPVFIKNVIKELADHIEPVELYRPTEQEVNFKENIIIYKKYKKHISKSLIDKKVADFLNSIEASISRNFKNKLTKLINEFGKHADTNFEAPSKDRAKDVGVESSIGKIKSYAKAYQELIDAIKVPLEAEYNSPQANAMYVLFYVVETKPLEECNQATAKTLNDILNEIPLEQ